MRETQSDRNDPRYRMRAARELTDNMRNERKRQDLGRAAFAEIMGEPRLAGLVSCSICGLLDDQDPCGDHA